jgi:acyl carrier protein
MTAMADLLQSCAFATAAFATAFGAKMYLDQVKTNLIDVLNLGDAGQALDAGSPLLGAIPELDSMAVIGVIAALEDSFGIVVDDDDISASTFATLGSLAAFVAERAE